MKNLTFFSQIKTLFFTEFKWKFLLLLLLIAGFYNTYAQDGSPSFSCGTMEATSTKVNSNDEIISPRSACTSTTATKYINVNLTFIMKSDGTGNYDETSDGLGGPVSGYQIAYEVIKTANELLANNPQIYQPIGNTISALSPRIQYLIKGVHFIRNTTPYNYEYYQVGSLNSYSTNLPTEINIFIAGDPIGASGVADAVGVFTNGGNPIVLIGEQMNASYNHGYTKSVFYKTTPLSFKLFYYAQIINHEVGHLLNLFHPFGCPSTSNPDGCTDTETFCTNSDFDPIPPQTNPYTGRSCPTSPTNTCSNTFMGYHINHNAITPCQINRIHNEIQTTAGMNYYDCNCLNPVPSFTITGTSGGTLYLNCDDPGTNVAVFIDASATQHENAYEITVEDINTGDSYTKIYYGPASTINLQEIFPNIQVNRVYYISFKAINTCGKQSTHQYLSIEYNLSCGGWFLRLSPNPASQNLKIEYNLDVARETDTEITVTEFNNPINRSTVKTKSKQQKGRHEIQVNTSDLINGMYIVTLQTPEKTLSQKVQILH